MMRVVKETILILYIISQDMMLDVKELGKHVREIPCFNLVSTLKVSLVQHITPITGHN